VPDRDPLMGKTVGSYRILAELGRGGMGVVYKAEDVSLQRLVALKVLPAQFAQEEEFIKRFSREARACAKLNHPNIVTVYGVGRHGDLYFIAMELVEGQALSSFMAEKGKLEFRVALDIIRQSAEALAEAHSKGIVHRDIKPQNIMLDPSGRVKVMDFGLARSHFETTKLTASGAVLGTPHYMSPEQWDDSKVDARSDIYSLGVTLFEMLTGKSPFMAETPVMIMRKVITEPTPSLTREDPEAPPRLAGMVAKMMAKKPGDRFATAAELRDEIDAYLGKQPKPSASVMDFSPPDVDKQLEQLDQQSAIEARSAAAQTVVSAASATPAPAAKAFAEPSRSRTWLWAAVAAVVVGVAAVATWALLSQGPFTSPLFPEEDFVWIEPGTFQMGSPDGEVGRNADEATHTVTLSTGFWMGKFEVTQRPWRDVMGSSLRHSRATTCLSNRSPGRKSRFSSAN